MSNEVEFDLEEKILSEKQESLKRAKDRDLKYSKDNNIHIQYVKVKCIATDDGYFKGRIVKAGNTFIYDNIVKNGKFPLWCEPVHDAKYDLEWDKLSELEKAKYLAKPKSVVKDIESNSGLEAEIKKLKSELEMSKALLADAEERISKSDDVKEVEESIFGSPNSDGENLNNLV